MRRILLGLLVGAIGYSILAVLHFSAKADEWTAEEINKTIEQTNFIVNRGCSGTLIGINPSLILTNYHCIDGNVETVEREVTTPDGTVVKKKFRKYADVPVEQKTYDGFTLTGSANYIAEIVAETKTSDLALLKIKGRTPHSYFSPIIPDGQPVLRGEKVWIVGNPLGLESTVTAGIISANRSLDPPWADGARVPVLQISGGMSPGNSGGSLYNSKGQLVGIPFAGYQGNGHLGFAVSIDVVKAFLREKCFAQTFDKDANDDRCRAEKILKDKLPRNSE
jgi:S1-C subfamily serine protease